jgi:hypothetical protein
MHSFRNMRYESCWQCCGQTLCIVTPIDIFTVGTRWSVSTTSTTDPVIPGFASISSQRSGCFMVRTRQPKSGPQVDFRDFDDYIHRSKRVRSTPERFLKSLLLPAIRALVDIGRRRSELFAFGGQERINQYGSIVAGLGVKSLA